ncbi:MAG: DUF4417 domain-containing protein [Turicibacter sp.]|nr:DUF4417 domain-containing protein [Turicibacter sp.]
MDKLMGVSNFHIADYSGANAYNLPEIMPSAPIDVDGVRYFGISEWSRIKDRGNAILHGFSYDYHVNRLWNNPKQYLSGLQKFRAVCTPDFSMYTDLPWAVKVYNAYKRQWLGRFWQENDVTVISTLSWGEGQIEDWTFDGVPKRSPVAFSLAYNNMDLELAVAEIKRILDLLEPSQIFVKGGKRKLDMLDGLGVEFEIIPLFVPSSKRKEEE